MRRNLPGLLFLAAACSGNLPERVGDLSDRQIRAICSSVQRQTDIECTENGSTSVIEELSADVCIDSLERMRDSDTEWCVPTQDVEDCWDADACAREGLCSLECPEYRECWDYTVDDCPVDNGFCAVQPGRRYDAANGCYEPMDAYCWPTNRVCASQSTTALDDAGHCWLMSSICAVPAGWQNEDGSRSCPYESEAPDC